MTHQEVHQLIEDYLVLFPDETDYHQPLLERLRSGAEPFNNRSSFSGHGTGAAIVLSPDRTELLLIHHKSLDKWLQPGGHWDPEDSDPWSVAQREAEEETGVRIAERLNVDPAHPDIPLDIDSHNIPDRPSRNEPAHVHHDIRYAFVAADKTLTAQEKEVNEAVWVSLSDLDDPRLEHLQGCIAKLKHFGFIQ